MSEITKDIRVAARGYVGHSHRWIGPDEVTTLIARAIHTERKRCADVALREGDKTQPAVGYLISKAIEATQ